MRTQQGQAIHLKDYREPDYWAKTVDINFDLHAEATRVTSTVTYVRNKSAKSGASLMLDGDALKLVSVTIDGKPLTPAQYVETPTALTITKPPAKHSFNLEIVTEVNPSANTKLMGLYRSGGNYCTQCEAEGFRRITFFPDRPDVLAVYTTRIEADKSENPILLGNGNPLKKGSAGKGRHYAIWHDPHPKPSYLFALVAGNLGSIHQNFKTMSGRKVKLGIYVEKGKEDNADYAMDALVRSMKWDEEVFGCEYDLDVFNIVAVSDFNMGAMENKGLNIFNDKYVLGDAKTATDADFANIEGIIAHEYFHNWTGNRITCRDWFQLCLKEGLTVFRDQEFSSDMRSRPVKRIADVKRLKTDQFPEDAGPLSHPVRPQTYHEINNFYTATIYEKGAELVRMIATILGETKFRKGMALYLKRHDGDAATIEHFIKCFEQAGKIDLSQFMHWYSQAGTPLLNVSSTYDRAKKKLTLEVEQITAPTPGQRRKVAQYIPQRIGLMRKDGTEFDLKKVTGADFTGGVLHFTKRRHKVVVFDVDERPIVSLNRGFTAPVEVNYRQSDADLAFLAQYDTDSFARWQALQTYATRLLIKAAKSASNGNRVSAEMRLVEILEMAALDDTLEPAFRAALLQLPSEGDLAQAIGKNVDPDAILKALKLYAHAIGKSLEPHRAKLIKALSQKGEFSADAASAGKRSLISVLNAYGVKSNQAAAKKDVVKRYKSADNMTDRFNALMTIVHHHSEKGIREQVLADFYKRYQDNHIILDKWFSVQAMRPGSATVGQVKKLMKHPEFTLNNPNRLRALIGVFAIGNPSAFNAANGAGFRLMANAIIKLDRINPQVAARLLTSFRSFNLLDSKRRKHAEKALRSIQAQKELSRDVADILTRTLAG